MGEHKGSGLALVCELLAGVLTGSGTAGDDRPVANGMLSIFLRASAFGDENAIAREVRAYADFVKSAKPAAPGGEVLLPGEPERRTRDKRLAEGVPLSDQVWDNILATAQKAGLTQDEIDQLLASNA
jgi:uncharacterized oxidoreductase